MSQVYGVAPGIDFKEQAEEGLRSEGIANAIGIVGVAKKGPTELTLLTSPQQCTAIFGEPHQNNSAVMAALVCLKNSREVYFKRVVSSTAKKGATTAEGWAVFSTKEYTDLYNGCSVVLTWENVGTEDEPEYSNQVTYEFKNAAGAVLESFVCSDDKDDELYLERVVNLYSAYVSVVISTTATNNKTATTLVLADGDAGLNATVEEIIGSGNTGMQAFADPEAADIATLIVPTYADQKVWEEAIKIGEYRKDIVFIPSLPAGLTPKQVADLVRANGLYKETGLKFDYSFISLYWPNGLLKNTKTGGMDVVDIAPYIATTFAHSDSITNVWTAPAGVKRGVIQGLDGLEYNTTKGERDELYAADVNVNSIVNVKGHGITIMGVRTSKRYKITDGNTALRYINIRRLCNYVRKVVLTESLNNLFDQNDYYTWNDWKMRIDPYLRAIQETRGLYDYKVIMDETTVTQADIDAGRMPGIIKIAPTKPNEYITINFVVAKDGTVAFDNEVEV